MGSVKLGMKKLSFGLHRVKGRSKGRISMYQRGGGHKRRYRYVDFYRNLPNVIGKILEVVYDPYRSSYLFCIGYTNGIVSYTLGIKELGVGDYIETRKQKGLDFSKPGISCFLGSVKVGSKVHNIEVKPRQGGQLVRSAGSCAILLKKYETKGFGLVKLPSKEYRLLPLECMCTIGTVSNPDHKDKKLAKAGSNRWRGKRPHVRGQAMNPVDHPHGGRTNGGKVPRTPWGQTAKGIKTSRSRSQHRVKLRNV